MMEGLGAFILLWGMILWGLWTMHQQKKNKDMSLSHHSDKEGENNNGEDKNGNHASV